MSLGASESGNLGGVSVVWGDVGLEGSFRSEVDEGSDLVK